MKILGLGFVTLALLVGCCTPLQAQDGEACLRLFGGNLKDKPLSELKLSTSELKLVTKKRACVRSYGLPGGRKRSKTSPRPISTGTNRE